ncbi:MAG: hypothetical protein CMB45_02900 [Euryarchaeota archaeon]|nr:hypothetical protein [Euryarchaeota archaeon]|tara:strand:+ start:1044 stop:1715 length:672 start_codon:yes stop_codon:yes gene_type:complete
MWVHANGIEQDVHSDFKEAIFPGAACLLRTIFEEYESFEEEKEFSVELINQTNLTQRAVFAGEAFLMLFDPGFSLPKRALHEAFAVEFLLHTVSHISNEIFSEEFELRRNVLPIFDRHYPGHSLGGWDNEDLDDWQEVFGYIAAELVGEQDFEYGLMLNRLDDMGASFVGRLFSDLNAKGPNYFDGYDTAYIEKNMNQIVGKCAKIIEFIEKYQKNGNFRAHP